MISFLSVFPPYRGGIATFSDALYNELKVQTVVKPFGFKKLYPKLLFPGTSQTLSEEQKKYATPVFHPYQPLNWHMAADKIMQSHPDVFLYSYWHPFFAPGLSRLIRHIQKKDASIKTVGIAHNILPHEYFPLKEWLVRNLLNRTDLTVLLSSQTEKDFQSLKTDSASLKLFHPIYELPEPSTGRTKLRERFGFRESDKVVLFMGLVREYKGVDLLIEAMNKIHTEGDDIKVMIVGEFYADKASLLEKIKPNCKNKYTIIDEFIPEQKMSDILALADLLVLPYRKGTQSGILANAIHCRLPALVSDLTGLSEHITHRENGLVFRAGDAQHLGQNIKEYFRNDMNDKLSANLTRLKEELSWKKFARQLLSDIESL